MTIITNSPLTNYNNAAIQKNVVSLKAATIPDVQNDTVEIQGKKWGLSKGAKIGIGLGAVGSIAIAIALLAKEQQNAAGISYYATKSPLEFVAETYAEILRGTKISDETMELYKRFKGPAI